ncbi:two-component system response regulator [Niveibacterium umoris]|uniref:Putative two-component system response regulator n=1 Tax=Niveibacterium umoris TaxID=1193620 RepID=A0A840BKQ7_9RHOO|nr:two-component system response regulator [Niveibacterium umoris]MBB4013203.1 putative two-component system response regulator [Niveibacterium umoris]
MLDLRSRPTVLIVDDAADNIDILSNALKDDYRVKVANSGERALRQVYSDTPPDLILLDVMMPEMSGHEVCRRLKANPDRRRIPVIFVTSMDAAEDEAFGLSLGAVDYITKPISPAIVRARVRTHLALYDQTLELEKMVAQRTAELSESRRQLIGCLARAAEFRDNETGNHVMRMSHSARLIALAMGLGPLTAELIQMAAPMHDIGKIGTPDRVLLKAGPLAPEEWTTMKRHAGIGAEIIGEHDDDLLRAARSIAMSHHEKWDGSGYPAGLSGDAIPIEGRIVALADVFDALMSVRPYKAALSLEAALDYIRSQSGRHFDPTVVAAFEHCLPDLLEVRQRYLDEGDTGAAT